MDICGFGKIQPGNGNDKEDKVAQDKTGLVFCCDKTDKNVEQENDAYPELDLHERAYFIMCDSVQHLERDDGYDQDASEQY